MDIHHYMNMVIMFCHLGEEGEELEVIEVSELMYTCVYNVSEWIGRQEGILGYCVLCGNNGGCQIRIFLKNPGEGEQMCFDMQWEFQQPDEGEGGNDGDIEDWGSDDDSVLGWGWQDEVWVPLGEPEELEMGHWGGEQWDEEDDWD